MPITPASLSEVRAAPANAALPRVDSTEALSRLLARDNRNWLRIIGDSKPQSVAELARPAHRAQPNLPRTLGKLEASGLLEIRTIDRRRAPTTKIGMLRLAIDPYAMSDRIEISLRVAGT